MARSNPCLPTVVRRQDRGRRSTSRTSSAASSAASLRLTVAWSTFRLRAAPESVPLCATARKCRMSSQSTICADSQGSLAYIPNFRIEHPSVFARPSDEGEQNAMPGQRFGVGIVGVEPDRSWAARSHIPALRALPEIFEIIGVANTTKASAEAAAAATGLPRAFADGAELVAAPEVDIVTVAVQVPPHLEIVKAAIGAGKHVYCEWPLGNGLAEAKEMAGLAQAKGVLGVVGTQARVAPEIEYLRHLIADGFVGDVLSTTLVARGGSLQGGGSIPNKKSWAYLLDRSNGATLLTIPKCHTLAALKDVFGAGAPVSAVLAVL